MRKLIYLKVLLILINFPLASYGQGTNLQFNQVLNLKNGESYTVPPGKVVKVESIFTDYTGYTTVYNIIGCISSAPTMNGYRCFYKLSNQSSGVHIGLANSPFTIYRIGDLNAKTQSPNYTGFTNDTLYFDPTSPPNCINGVVNGNNACPQSFNIDMTPNTSAINNANLPIWLKAGKTIEIAPLPNESNIYSIQWYPSLSNDSKKGSGTFITAIEFNIVP